MNLIKELSTDYPDAWKAFMEWFNKSEFAIIKYYGLPLSGAPLPLQLTILQAFLDSVGVYCDANQIVYGWMPEINDGNGERIWWGSFGYFDSRAEALTAAVKKGMEIFQNQIKI